MERWEGAILRALARTGQNSGAPGPDRNYDTSIWGVHWESSDWFEWGCLHPYLGKAFSSRPNKCSMLRTGAEADT